MSMTECPADDKWNCKNCEMVKNCTLHSAQPATVAPLSKKCKDPNFAPVYCALYPELAKITRKHGYALAVHGSLARDFDLICVPWVPTPSEPADVVREITTEFYLRQVGDPDVTLHGRERWMLSVGYGECAIDLSFMPRTK